MSMFNKFSNNDINLRLNEIILNELYIKNPETNNYDRFIPGSGSSGELPYYIKPDKIKLENESNFTEILESGVNINGETLNNSSLSELNKIYNKTDIAHFVDKKFLLYDSTVKNYRTAPVPSYLKFFLINFDNSYSSSFMNTDKINFTNKTTTDYSENTNNSFKLIKSPSTISNIIEIKPESITVGNHLDYSDVPYSSAARTIMSKNAFYAFDNNVSTLSSLSPIELNFSLPALGATNLNHTKVTNLNKFLNRTTTSDMTNKKMLLVDSVTNNYHFSDVPASSSYTPPPTFYGLIPTHTDSVSPGIYTTSYFPSFNGQAISTGMAPISPSYLRRYKLKSGESLILKTQNDSGATDDTVSLNYSTWYAITLSKDVNNYAETKAEGIILNAAANEVNHSLDFVKCPINTPTTPYGSTFLFRINGRNADGSLKSRIFAFFGTLKFKVISYNDSELPNAITF